jgi:hypothetical protein
VPSEAEALVVGVPAGGWVSVVAPGWADVPEWVVEARAVGEQVVEARAVEAQAAEAQAVEAAQRVRVALEAWEARNTNRAPPAGGARVSEAAGATSW